MKKINKFNEHKNFKINQYVYYSVGTNHNGHDDVAITSAYTIEDAIGNLKEYYNDVNENNVKLIDLNREGFVKNVMVVSDY